MTNKIDKTRLLEILEDEYYGQMPKALRKGMKAVNSAVALAAMEQACEEAVTGKKRIKIPEVTKEQKEYLNKIHAAHEAATNNIDKTVIIGGPKKETKKETLPKKSGKK
jgi:hypothetical protein